MFSSICLSQKPLWTDRITQGGNSEITSYNFDTWPIWLGKNELGGLPYWGYAGEVDHRDFMVHESSRGPISSFHDRACEVAA